uniref:Uncharacterized protein n=1 Tax=Pipistrellus kuhlii TaxID=59472 RepID=A0A7J7WDE4_PIPKU|nr:hypothetical protein mPipKuh1_008024 [Pipistrellus kuhlii]
MLFCRVPPPPSILSDILKDFIEASIYENYYHILQLNFYFIHPLHQVVGGTTLGILSFLSWVVFMLWGWGRVPSGLQCHLCTLLSQYAALLSLQFVAPPWTHQLLVSAKHLGQSFLLFPCHVLVTGFLLLLFFHVGAPRTLGGVLKGPKEETSPHRFSLEEEGRGSPCYSWILEAS